MTCLNPYYLIQYSGEQFRLKTKQGFSLIKGTNQNLATLTEDSRAALVQVYNLYTKRGKVIRGPSN